MTNTWIENFHSFRTIDTLTADRLDVDRLYEATVKSLDEGAATGGDEATLSRLHTIVTALECYRDVIDEAISSHPDREKLPG